MRVKICGITNREDARAAVEAGADALGFILYPKSPRHIEPSRAGEIGRELPPFVQRVAVTVNLARAEADAIARAACFDLWQLHGDEDEAACRAWRPRRVVKVLRLSSDPLPDVSRFEVDAFLLDTPAGAAYGGTGRTFDWKRAVEFKRTTGRPIILSGGLRPENVAEAIKAVHPYAVDVSSGVESSPGRKDHVKLRDFIQICKSF